MESLLSLSKKMGVIKKVKPLEIAFCIFKNVLSSPENTLLLMGYSVTIRFLKNRAIVTFQNVIQSGIQYRLTDGPPSLECNFEPLALLLVV